MFLHKGAVGGGGVKVTLFTFHFVRTHKIEDFFKFIFFFRKFSLIPASMNFTLHTFQGLGLRVEAFPI